MDNEHFATVRLSHLALRVDDAARVAGFYRDVLGLEATADGAGRTALAAPGDTEPLLVLESAAGSPPRPARSAGLFHVALLYADRVALARALRRVVDAGVSIGAADHGVSEAIYLSDPEGNGLELYVDRPAGQWPPRTTDGQVAMFTEALDVEALLREAADLTTAAHPARIGHVHLSVSSLDRAERFYGDTLGFRVTQRSYPGALFLARDGYHHHLGANVWRSSRPAEPGALGLAGFTIHLAPAEREAVRRRLDLAGLPAEAEDASFATRDLDGIRIRLAPMS